MALWTADLAARMLAVSGRALTALDEGRCPYLEVCAGVAAVVGATSAVYIHVDLRRGRSQTVCWPDGRRAKSSHGASVPRLSAAAEAVTHDVVALPLSAAPEYLRLVSLTKPGAFDESDHGLLSLMHSSVLALDVHLRSLESAPLGPVGSLDPEWPPSTAPHRVTLREVEVLNLLADGMTAQAIARRLSLSPRTVHKHLGSLYVKLGTHDRLTAVARGQQMGIVPPAIGLPGLRG